MTPAAEIPAPIRAKCARGEKVVVFVDLERPAAATADRDARSRAFQREQSRCLDSLPAGSFSLQCRYRYSPVLLLETRSPRCLDALARNPRVRRVYSDEEGTGSMVQARELIRANEAEKEFGVTGEGLVVAIVDSGIDVAHPDFEGRILHEKLFLDELEGDSAQDEHGHGTNVAGILASAGVVSARGLAPDAGIVAIRALNSENRGKVSDWAEGVEHIVGLHRAALDGEEGGIFIDAINLSLQTTSTFLGRCDEAFTAFEMACD